MSDLKHRRRAARAGFTLIELMVALSLAGLVASLVVQTLSTALRVSERSRVVLAAERREALTQERVRTWIREARTSPRSDPPMTFESADRRTPLGPSDSLVFVTADGAPLLPGRTRVRLFVDRDDLTPERGLVLVMESWNPGPEAIRKIELAPRATGLDAAYLFDLEGEPIWFRGWDSASSLPIAVELQASGDSLPSWLAGPLTIRLGWSG